VKIKSTCPVCKGAKVERDSEIIDVSIERGMKDGDVITFDGASDQHPDHSPGDIKFIIKTRTHPTFTRRGDNLYMKETITLYEVGLIVLQIFTN
jgi:DnaJ-class molecular chaperone